MRSERPKTLLQSYPLATSHSEFVAPQLDPFAERTTELIYLLIKSKFLPLKYQHHHHPNQRERPQIVG
ncbi:hypothetical protein AWQ24_08585 [Picosynechococcus sp. PCC 8807]|nr:hypothetical protein AWQ24_08585 [Picosynechococcus sp. PCC 8807]